MPLRMHQLYERVWSFHLMNKAHNKPEPGRFDDLGLCMCVVIGIYSAIMYGAHSAKQCAGCNGG